MTVLSARRYPPGVRSCVWTMLVVQGCTTQAPVPEVSVSASGLTVHAPASITQVEVRDPEGVPLLPQRPPVPVEEVELRGRLDESGTYTVAVDTLDGSHTVEVPLAAPPAALSVVVEAPVGQGRREITGGAEVPFPLIDGHPVQAALTLTARQPGSTAIRIGGQPVADGQLVDGRWAEIVPDGVLRQKRAKQRRAQGERLGFNERWIPWLSLLSYVFGHEQRCSACRAKR